MNPNINTLQNSDIGGGYPNGIPQIDCKEKAKQIWNSIPLFVKFIIVSSLVLYLINLIFNPFGFYLANVPYYTIYKIQIWRIITSTFLNTSLLNILFGLLSWVKDGTALELSMGTIRYMFVFLINGICIQIIHTLIIFIIFLILRNDKILSLNAAGYSVENNGLWPIIMAEMTLLCMANPESPMRLFFFPCEIKAKFYPFILFALFMVMSGFQIQFDLFAGIIYGVIYHFLLRNRIAISDSFAKKCEDSFIFRWMKNFKGFVPANNSGQPVVMVRGTGSYSTGSTASEENSAPSSNQPTTFQAFRGKGVAVGGSLGTTNGDYQGLSQNNQSQI